MITAVKFLDDVGIEWNYQVVAVPRIGDKINFDAAPHGTMHEVIAVEHAIGGMGHRITVYLKRV